MRYGKAEMLFYKFRMHNVMDAHQKKAGEMPAGMNDNVLLNTPTEDLVAQIVDQCSLSVPVLCRENAEAETAEGPVQVYSQFRDYGGDRGPLTMQGTIIDLVVPFSGDKDFFFIQPTTFDTAPPYALVENNGIVLRHSSREFDAAQAKAGFNNVLDQIDKYLGWLRSSAESLNASLPGIARTAVEARKAKVLKDRNSVANLGFKIKSRPDAPKCLSEEYLNHMNHL